VFVVVSVVVLRCYYRAYLTKGRGALHMSEHPFLVPSKCSAARNEVARVYSSGCIAHKQQYVRGHEGQEEEESHERAS
jgi:hypothetical protein